MHLGEFVDDYLIVTGPVWQDLRVEASQELRRFVSFAIASNVIGPATSGV
jgi:hypothetical protein